MIVAGIMSGTSLDGIDVAIVDIRGKGWTKKVETIGCSGFAYSKAVREALLGVSNQDTHTREIARLHFLLPELYATAVMRACLKAEVDLAAIELVGCHGQTIFHEGQGSRFLGRQVASTLQIGDGSVLAERLGIPVVSDFRTRDVAAGGLGAPLVPYVDYLLFRDLRRGRVALNIGGIANVTHIPAGAEADEVMAFDTGPGNMVIDQVVQRVTGGKQSFDAGGKLGLRGIPDEQFLRDATHDRFYRKRPPKTAGREEYGADFVDKLMKKKRTPEDAVATATALTARTIARALFKFCWPRGEAQDMIVSGGGIHNAALMKMLARELSGVTLYSSEEFGIDPDAKEAIAFAILAYETWHGRPSNLPSATGARCPVILGKLSPV